MKKRVVLISNQAFSMVNFRGELIQKLVGSGCEVFALAPDISSDLRHTLESFGAHTIQIPLARMGMNPLRELNCMFRLAFMLKHIQPDVILSYSIKPVIFGTLAAWISRVPRRVAMIEGLGYVFTPSDHQLPKLRRGLVWLVRRLYWLALMAAGTVIFLNHDDAEVFVTGNLVSIKKIVVLGGIGVDLDTWRYSLPPTGPVCFVMVARLLREKGVYEYVRAIRILREKLIDARFILLGGLDMNPGSLRKEEVEEWVSSGLLEWPGHVDVKPWLELASVFVLPSYREGVPRSTQEAMAVGRAVITTDVPGCRDTVIDGENGFLIPARDSLALADAMLNFINEPSLVSAMGLESRRIAEERFDVNEVNARLINSLGLS